MFVLLCQVTVSPLPPEQTSRVINPQWNHVSRPGKEELVVVIHAVTGLPVLPTGDVPVPFVVS